MTVKSVFAIDGDKSSLRKAGVILHITSLPNGESNAKSGCLDDNAWKFVDWLEQAGLKVWQLLPLNAPHDDLSPYSALSAFAMNPRFLPADWQEQLQELSAEFADYLAHPPAWLEDYAMFIALREYFGHQSWSDWPQAFKFHQPEALQTFAQSHASQILYVKQKQFMLQHLWHKLKAYANQKGIVLFGDMPIFVAYDSADVWANPHNFKLDDTLSPTVVAGVPPDYFSQTGQRWGNPHYDWEAMQQDDFAWWTQRVAHALEQLDVLRIDHFRGLEACWEIAAEEETAMNGVWQKVPGDLMLAALQRKLPRLPLVAEDLGIITPEVVALKEQFGLPGMAVLQFGFNGLPDNPHALEEQIEHSVAYSGTHDNNTSVGWFEELDSGAQNWIWSQLEGTHDVLNKSGIALVMPWPLLAAGLKSVPTWFIAPMQDWLMLNGDARMNIPGTVGENWRWQLQADQLQPKLAQKIALLVKATGR